MAVIGVSKAGFLGAFFVHLYMCVRRASDAFLGYLVHTYPRSASGP